MNRVVVHSLEQARAALAADGNAEIWSAPDAASLAGVGWWREVVRLARAEFPQAVMVLDCGTAPGIALAAMRAGITDIALQASPEASARVMGIAEKAGVRLRR